MNRRQLEHLIRAAAHIADHEELVILGSQAVLGQFPEAPDKGHRTAPQPMNRPYNRTFMPRVAEAPGVV